MTHGRPSGTFVHWVVTGIEPTQTAIDEGGTPARATQGVNGFGDEGYGGPQPPVGDGAHRYFFTVHAACKPLGLAGGCTAAEVYAALEGNELASGTLVGLFQR